MSTPVDVYIINRRDLKIKSFFTTTEWEIKIDYINNSKSSFTNPASVEVARGDFLLAKLQSGRFSKLYGSDRIQPFFFGLVSSFENKNKKNVIESVQFYNVADNEFSATAKSGTDVKSHLLALLNRYVLSDETSLTSRIAVRLEGGNVPYSYQPSNPPTKTNLRDYFIHMFKKYGVCWNVEWIGPNDRGELIVSTVLKVSNDRIKIKNNSLDFFNWSVFIQEVNKNSDNRLLIIDKRTNNSESPGILSTWYLDKNGEITQSSSNVSRPTRTKVAIYDTTVQNKPSYLSVAQSELSANNYSHEIDVSVIDNSELVRYSDLEIGKKVSVFYNERELRSILTSLSYKSEHGYFELTFGNVRSTIKNLS